MTLGTSPKAIIAGIMDRVVPRPGHNMLAHEVIKTLGTAGYAIVPAAGPIGEPDAGLIAHLWACADRSGQDSSTAHLLRCAAERLEQLLRSDGEYARTTEEKA
jgi:hypothetical protein